jgi:hypothetical protein
MRIFVFNLLLIFLIFYIFIFKIEELLCKNNYHNNNNNNNNKSTIKFYIHNEKEIFKSKRNFFYQNKNQNLFHNYLILRY